MNYIVYVKNYDTQKIELYFTDIPDYHTRSVLKRNGWWWSPDNGYWCAF